MGRFAQALERFRSILTPSPPARGGGGWVTTVREPYTGAWQQNAEVTVDGVAAFPAVFACMSTIAQDVGKVSLRLVQKQDGIWIETDNPAWSPVLRKPNPYQTIVSFKETWILNKLAHGNTYVLKQRDARGVVKALYVLDSTKVRPLVAPNGDVYYQLGRVEAGRHEQLARIDPTDEAPIVPASEIIHDLMNPLFHPLMGVSPLFACGTTALQGQTIQSSSARFFANGANPGGLLIVPLEASDDQVARIKAKWEQNQGGLNQGRIAVITGGLKYEPLSMSAVDAQLIDQLKWTAETVCSAFHIPPYLVNIGPPPPYANVEPLVQQYYASCLQSLFTAFETCLDEGLELPTAFGTEFDVTDLILMDTATRTKAAHDSINAGALSPNEARRRYFGLGPVPGGDSPYLQQQYYSLEALNARDTADPPPPPPPAPPPAPGPDDLDGETFEAAFLAVQRHALTEGLYDA